MRHLQLVLSRIFSGPGKASSITKSSSRSIHNSPHTISSVHESITKSGSRSIHNHPVGSAVVTSLYLCLFAFCLCSSVFKQLFHVRRQTSLPHAHSAFHCPLSVVRCPSSVISRQSFPSTFPIMLVSCSCSSWCSNCSSIVSCQSSVVSRQFMIPHPPFPPFPFPKNL